MSSMTTAALERLPVEVGDLAARPLERWLIAGAVLFLGLAAGWVARRWLLNRLRALAARTSTQVDDLLLEASRGMWAPGILLLATALAVRASPLPPDLRGSLVRFALSAFLALAVVLAARFASAALTGGAGPGRGARPTLLQTAARLAIFAAGSLLVLDNLGIEITSLVTALGVGSLAVGLALQPTLSNFFAGLHLSMAQPVRVGDFVELEDGTQGHVVDIGWRATKIRQLANNLVIVPNSRLAEMRLVNYSLPDAPQAVLVPVGVAYGSDLERVERVTVEVAREVQGALPEADPTHEPFLRYGSFGASAIEFNVILRAVSFTDRWPLVHEFVRRLDRRYRAEGIEIPFPQRVVHHVGGPQ